MVVSTDKRINSVYFIDERVCSLLIEKNIYQCVCDTLEVPVPLHSTYVQWFIHPRAMGTRDSLHQHCSAEATPQKLLSPLGGKESEKRKGKKKRCRVGTAQQ